jgi:hypothetical protein
MDLGQVEGKRQRDHIQIGDPAAVAHLLNAGPYMYEKDTVEKPRFETMFGAGLLSANGAYLPSSLCMLNVW